MSYCVNCGVELDDSVKKCALCGAPVLNPFIDESEKKETPYPDRIFLPPQANRRYIAFILSMAVLIPNIVCAAVNILTPGSGWWSGYVAAVSLPVWTFFIVPFLMKKTNGYLILTFDTAAVALSAFMFAFLQGELPLFLRFILPVIISVALSAFIFFAWLKGEKRDWPHIIIFILVQISVCALAIDIFFHLFYKTFPVIQYSLAAVLSCLALAGFFVAVSRNRHLRAWLSRRFFF